MNVSAERWDRCWIMQSALRCSPSPSAPARCHRRAAAASASAAEPTGGPRNLKGMMGRDAIRNSPPQDACCTAMSAGKRLSGGCFSFVHYDILPL